MGQHTPERTPDPLGRQLEREALVHARSELEQLASALLGDLDRIAARTVTRVQELPSYSTMSPQQLALRSSTSTRILLESIRAPDAKPRGTEDHMRVLGEARLTHGISTDEMLQASQIVLEVVREEAHRAASQLGIGDGALLEFVEASVQWGDLGMRTVALAYREEEIRELERLAAEQAALQRVATMIARESPPEEVFAQVTEELGRLLQLDLALRTVRFEPDGTATILAADGIPKILLPAGTNIAYLGGGVLDQVFRTGRPGRVDDYALVAGPLGATVRGGGIHSAVAGPIVVDGRIWGAMVVGSETAMPSGTEDRVAKFAELVSTAISNVESRAEVERLAAEQSALRRVATLVAQGVASETLFGAAAEEVGRLFGADYSGMIRYEANPSFVTTMATWAAVGEHPPAPVRFRTEPGDPTAMVAVAGGPARVDDWTEVPGPIAEFVRGVLGVKSSVGSPIVVHGSLWGALALHSKGGPLPPDTESRLLSFTELLGTAIANTSARSELSELAEEQAALRRVATLVARGVPPDDVFAAVAEEVGHVLPIEYQHLGRFESDGMVNYVAARGPVEGLWPVGTRLPLGGDNITTRVFETGCAARTDYSNPPGPIGAKVKAAGIRWSVGAPIVVEGRAWGVLIVSSTSQQPLPADTEERLTQFMELLGTAIANADGRDQLTASRARLVTEADEARRRVVRDLHDGAQQRLIQAIVTLKLAQRALELSNVEAGALIAEALAHAQQGNAELRELSHGILPAVLAQGGLRSGVRSIVSRLDLPVEVDVPSERFPAEIEASAYFVVAEALTNVVKHARAERAGVRACVEDGILRVEVRDDGVGGADVSGRGLVGLADRVTAIGGELVVESPRRGGTLLAAKLPVSTAQS